MEGTTCVYLLKKVLPYFPKTGRPLFEEKITRLRL